MTFMIGGVWKSHDRWFGKGGEGRRWVRCQQESRGQFRAAAAATDPVLPSFWFSP